MTKFADLLSRRFSSSSSGATRGNRQSTQRNSPVFGVRIDRYFKVLNRNAFIGLLCALVGLSFISTVSFWSFVRNGVAVKSIHGNRAAGILGKNSTPSTATQHSLEWHDVVGHLNLGGLFAIKPANRKEPAGKKTAQNDGPYSVTKTSPPQVVCPELVIPGLIEKKALDLNDLSMNQSEVYVLGEQIKQTQDATKEGNRQLYHIVEVNQRYNLTVKRPIMDSLSQLAVKVGNYSWFPGGHWKPTNCLPRWKVAIIIPFRDRFYHLPIILKYLTPMLRRQLLEFAFYVVEQNNSLAFNRAMLMNVGFLESLNFSHWDCFIFHDVDHIPLSDFNYYGCSGMPRHFLSGADRWKYKLPYDSFFGAVTGLTTGNIRKINGFPNVYWGWGGEDDEIWKRVKDAGLPISRTWGPAGFYNVITHHHNSAPKMKERMQLLKNSHQRYKTDGLTNMRYKKPHVEFHLLYTTIAVDIQKLSIATPKVQPAPPAKQQPAPPEKKQPAPPEKKQPAPPEKQQPAPPEKQQPAPPEKKQPAPPEKQQPAPPEKKQPAPPEKQQQIDTKPQPK